MQAQPSLRLVVICAGDLVALGLVTLIGFATHGELTRLGPRLLTTLIPLVAAWVLIAPWLGVFTLKYTQAPLELWRPVLAILLSAPMAGWLRGLMLGAPVIPVFVLALGVTAAFGLLIWRGLFLVSARWWGQTRIRGQNG